MSSDSAITRRGIALFLEGIKSTGRPAGDRQRAATQPVNQAALWRHLGLPASGLKIRALRDLVGRTLPVLAGSGSTEVDEEVGDDPLLSTWYTQSSGLYARVIREPGGSAAAAWAGMERPSYTDIVEVSSTTDFVYVTSIGLPSHQIGPWATTHHAHILPVHVRRTYRVPRTPWLADIGVVTAPGDVGIWVNGIPIGGLLEHGYHDLATGRDVEERDAEPFRHLWLRHTPVETRGGLDPGNGRPSRNREYRYHGNPLALRSQLRDNVVYLPRTDCFREAAQPTPNPSLKGRESTSLRHSPILGWTFEGLPIYGPYGYSDPLEQSSGVRRMVSGFVLRDGRRGTTDLTRVGRRSMPRWAASLHGTGERLAPQQVGPDVSAEFELGRYAEDYDYLGDVGGVQGRDFDLDICNGRYCVTPEFPDGTFAYFTAIGDDGAPVFPYVVGPRSYGLRDGGAVRQLPDEAKVRIKAGASSTIRLDVRSIGTDHAAESGGEGQQLLTWTSIEGGRYRVDGSQDGRNWYNVAVDLPSQGLVTEYTHYPAPETRPYRHFWVTLTAAG